VEYFVDTCVIVGYASYIKDVLEEGDDEDCYEFFSRELDRITSENVRRELNNVRKRRLKLYSDITTAIGSGKDLSELRVEDRVRSYYQAILNALESGKMEKSLQEFRKIEMLFKNRCREAISKRIKEIVDVEKEYERRYPGRGYEKASWDDLLGERIGNLNDGRVVMDCAILSSLRGKLVLVTTDGRHILNNTETIHSFIEEYCSVSLMSQLPDFEIRHPREL